MERKDTYIMCEDIMCYCANYYLKIKFIINVTDIISYVHLIS